MWKRRYSVYGLFAMAALPFSVDLRAQVGSPGPAFPSEVVVPGVVLLPGPPPGLAPLPSAARVQLPSTPPGQSASVGRVLPTLPSAPPGMSPLAAGSVQVSRPGPPPGASESQVVGISVTRPALPPRPVIAGQVAR